MTNDEYVALMRERAAMSFVDDVRATMREAIDEIDVIRFRALDLTPRELSTRLADMQTRLTRLSLRSHDREP